ncbi:MAG: carboxylate--amine ligase, partial [Planctomycetota bacterium]
MRRLKQPSPADLSGPRERRVMAICGDTQVGLWMVRNLGWNGLQVFAVVRSPEGLAAHSRSSSGAWQIENGPADRDAFAEEVEHLARELDVGSIMTISEGYHAALIACRDRFEPDIHVFSPRSEAFEKATDKDFMHQLCIERGVPVAEGKTLQKVSPGGCDLSFPVVLRTRLQNTGDRRAPWKAAYAETPQRLEQLREQVADFQGNVLVQEYHPGAEDHVQILMHRGE